MAIGVSTPGAHRIAKGTRDDQEFDAGENGTGPGTVLERDDRGVEFLLDAS